VEKVFDAIFSALMALFIAAGSGYAIKQTGEGIRRAALTKAAHGLPDLGPFASRLTSKRSK
jgi:hypothetical protein